MFKGIEYLFYEGRLKDLGFCSLARKEIWLLFSNYIHRMNIRNGEELFRLENSIGIRSDDFKLITNKI